MSVERILPVARELAARPEGMSNGDLAMAANLTASAAGAYIQVYMNNGHIFRGQPDGKRARYFTTQTAADAFRDGNQKPLTLQRASPDMLARAAVAQMRKDQIRSSASLAETLHVKPEQIDAALAPLVNAHYLTRVNVLRGGVTMFDYRFSAAWTPKSEDFDGLVWDGASPQANVSPVAAPKATPAPSPRPAPATAPVAPPKPARDALAAGGDLGRRPLHAEPDPVERKAEKAIEAAAELKRPTVLNVLRADDMVCAMNSRGELALDLANDTVLKFTPASALALKRFLDNTTVLESLSLVEQP
ncbi:MAG: hypothetical protein LCH79_07995 [Proteobacteria bacterium]|nr:hypothetical protein [Pseudomonadota bacterium]